MKTKTMRFLGVVFLIFGIAGFAGGTFFWFFHYWAMENGYRPYFGDSLIIACTISMFIGSFIYPAVPFLIISKIRRNREISESLAQNSVVLNNVNHKPSSINHVKYCIYCGKKVPASANFCSECGRKLGGI